MKILTCFQGESTTLSVRLFNAAHPSEDNYVNLSKFLAYDFTVTEVCDNGHKVLFAKDGADVWPSLDLPQTERAYPNNVVNVTILDSDSQSLVPNPPDRDKVRYWRIRGQEASLAWTVIDRGYFYIDSLTAV